MPEYTLREATIDDAAAIAAVHWTGRRAVYLPLVPEEHWNTDTQAAGIETWKRRLTAGEIPLVAEADGLVIGFAVVGQATPRLGHEPKRDLALHDLWVTPELHGSGISRALLNRALPPARSAELWIAAANTGARKFFQKNGFLPDATTGTGEDGVLEVRLVR
jgi:GNAT superfamily N-acetyltransferase